MKLIAKITDKDIGEEIVEMKEPIYRKSFSMNKEIKPKGFIISNQCIQCGLCQKNCPQQCISNYQIQQFDTPENIIKYPANNFVKKLVSKNES